MSKHPHAEVMAQYAQDALETDTPWERWHYRWAPDLPWREFEFHPRWHPDHEYRRKPESESESESESKSKYVHYFTTPVDNVSAMERVDSILLATHISIYEIDEQGHEQWVYDVEIPKALLDIFSTHQTAVELYNQL